MQCTNEQAQYFLKRTREYVLAFSDRHRRVYWNASRAVPKLLHEECIKDLNAIDRVLSILKDIPTTNFIQE